MSHAVPLPPKEGCQTQGLRTTAREYSGEAQIAETQLGTWRLIVRRTHLVGAQAELFPDWRHHCFATNRTVPVLVADIDHRDHATIELVIRDLKDQALGHFPCGHFNANNAWTVIVALAHNLGRWATQIALPDQPAQTARSRRRHLLQLPARLTRTSRQWTLRMRGRWPWHNDFMPVLDTIRALPAHLTRLPVTPPAPAQPHHPPRRSPLPETVTPERSVGTPPARHTPKPEQTNPETHQAKRPHPNDLTHPAKR